MNSTLDPLEASVMVEWTALYADNGGIFRRALLAAGAKERDEVEDVDDHLSIISCQTEFSDVSDLGARSVQLVFPDSLRILNDIFFSSSLE